MTETMKTLYENLNGNPIKIDGVPVHHTLSPISLFIKGDSIIILMKKDETYNYRKGYKLYPIRDPYDGDYFDAVPVVSKVYDGEWYPYDGGGICYEVDIPAGSAWGNERMDELDWFIFNSI